MGQELKELRTLLDRLGMGPVHADRVPDIAAILSTVWSSLEGSQDLGMEGYKLDRRMEEVVWEPPLLRFKIERHGGTVIGSSRAEMQQWVVDVETGRVTGINAGHRQLAKMDARLKIEPLVQRVAQLIQGRAHDDWITWLNDGTAVRVEVGRFIGANNKQTLTSRRRRFRNRLTEVLKSVGWHPVAGRTPYTFAYEQ